MLTTFFKGMTQRNITQIYHEGHKALDITGNNTNYGYGTPLCAPENCLVMGISDSGKLDDPDELAIGYGIRLKGQETGMDYLYWHCNPIFPVNGGDVVKRGQIVAYMGNAGEVYSNGKYVPLDQRTKAPYGGTHVHIQAEKDGVRLDPLPFINFNWQPQYTTMDWIGAALKTLNKISKKIS